MKAFKLIFSIIGILCILFVLQLYIQSREPHPFVWEEEELQDIVTALGAKDFSVSEKNIVTFRLETENALFDAVQEPIILFPGGLMDEAVAIPEGQETVEPVLFRNENGILQCTFSDGEQQLFRTQAQSRTFAVQQASRQIVLQLVNGMTLGGVYAMIAVGYTLVYGIMFMINFAHGEIFMFGAYGAFFVFSAMSRSDTLPLPWVLAFGVALLVAMSISAFVGVLAERTAYRPLRQAPRLTLLISAIGASIFLQNVMMLITSGRIKYYPDQVLVKGAIPLFGGIALEKIGMLIILLSVVMMAGLYTIIQKTKTGKAIRAVAEDRATASLMGINVNKIIVTTFLLGSSMAGAGGLMVGLRDTQINHMMGFLPGMKAFTAAVLGGIGNIPGAMFGGYFLGVAEALGAQFMPAEYKDVIAFSLLVLVLIFRPTGIMGEVLATKKM